MNDKKPIISNMNSSLNEGVVMQFSDDDNSSRGPSNQNGNGNRKPANGKGFWPLILLGVVFIAIVSLLIYFFAARSTGGKEYYGDKDLTYEVVIDGDTQKKSDGSPDFSLYDTTTDFKSVVRESSEGSLAKILINASENSPVTVTITFSNQLSDLVYLTGNYTKLTEKGVNVKVSYQANIDKSTYQNYVEPLLRYVSYYVSNQTVSVPSVEKSSDMSWILPVVLVAIFAIGIGFFVSRSFRSMGGSGSNPMSGFVNNVARKQTGSKIRFSDVAGCDEAKAELVEMVDYFHATDKYTRLGAKLPHGVLLVGPPGTGKTLLAKAVAGEANVPFYSISGSDFVEMYVGVGASRVRSLFKTAKQNAPCLIFIDEIDAVGRQRGAGLGGGNDEREQTLNELLVEMDGFEDNNGIIVMAATNRDDVLDPALTRPGRFDRKITVDLPDKNGRAAILKVHSRNKKLAPDVSFDSIAGRTVGFSGADLANIMNDAAILAVRSNRTAITTTDIDEAIDRAISGPAKRSHLEPEERKQVAYHEAGHAVVGIFLPYSDKVQKITIIPRGRTGGHVLMTPEKDRFLMTKNQLIARITGYLGGRTSEEIFFGDVSTGASNDIEVATNIARGMVTEYGMSELGPIQYEKPGGSVFLGRDYNSSQANYSAQTALEIDKQIRLIIDQCHEACRKLLEEHADDVKLIAETLIANETITADQIDYLLKNRKLPEVDEHKIVGEEKPAENPNNIILYPGYGWYYASLDNILKGKPSRLVVVVATGSGTPVNDVAFHDACVNGAKDPAHIGLLFVEYSRSMNISTSVETFAEHLEAYAGVPTLLIKTDDNTVRHLDAKFSPKQEDKPLEETKNEEPKESE
jgi:cell division protease FtsH